MSSDASDHDVVGFLFIYFVSCHPRHYVNLVLSFAAPTGFCHLVGMDVSFLGEGETAISAAMSLPLVQYVKLRCPHLPAQRPSWSELMEHRWGDGSRFQFAVEKPSGEGGGSLGSATRESPRPYLTILLSTNFFQKIAGTKYEEPRCGDRGGFRGLGPFARQSRQRCRAPDEVRQASAYRAQPTLRVAPCQGLFLDDECRGICQNHSQSHTSTFGY